MTERAYPFRTDNVLMTGDWVPYVIPNEANFIQFKLRTSAAMKWTTHTDGTNRVTLPKDQAQAIGSFNTDNQTIYFKAAAGTVVEIAVVNMP